MKRRDFFRTLLAAPAVKAVPTIPTIQAWGIVTIDASKITGLIKADRIGTISTSALIGVLRTKQ